MGKETFYWDSLTVSTGRELTAYKLLQMRRADKLCFMCCASDNDN